MLYVITFVDDPGTDKAKKISVRPTHLDYVSRNQDRIISSPEVPRQRLTARFLPLC